MPWNNQGNNKVEIRAEAHGAVAATMEAHGAVVRTTTWRPTLRNLIRCSVISAISLEAVSLVAAAQ